MWLKRKVVDGVCERNEVRKKKRELKEESGEKEEEVAERKGHWRERLRWLA